MFDRPKPFRIEAERRHGHLFGEKRLMREKVSPGVFGDCDHMIDLLPAIPHQPLLNAAVEIHTGTEFRKQQRLHIVDRRDKLPALPAYTRIVRKVQHIVRPDHQRRDLFPDAPAEQGKPDDPILHVRTCRERMRCVGKQNLVVIRAIDTTQCFNQFPGIPPDPDVKIPEMPGGDDDLHDVALDRSMVEEKPLPEGSA